MLVILATQEAEIRRIKIRSQPGEIVHETLSQKTHHKKRAGGVVQDVGPEFRSQYHKNSTLHLGKALDTATNVWEIQGLEEQA
jgi:hypothetical protein